MDEDVIELAKRGEEKAFQTLVEKYFARIFRVVYAILRDEKEAEDATQEVFLKVFHSLPAYENRGFKTWITRIAVNHAIDLRRKRMRRQENMVEEVVGDDLTAPAMENIEVILLKKERLEMIHEKIAALPENYREVIHGFYIEEKSYKQMAEEQGVEVKTIETKLYRARQWMKKHWKEDDFL